jgi:hypothetical protein
MSHDHDESPICEACLAKGAETVLDFAQIMADRLGSEHRADSPIVPIELGELVALIMRPPCACGECDNRIDAESIADYVTERMTADN